MQATFAFGFAENLKQLRPALHSQVHLERNFSYIGASAPCMAAANILAFGINLVNDYDLPIFSDNERRVMLSIRIAGDHRHGDGRTLQTIRHRSLMIVRKILRAGNLQLV